MIELPLKWIPLLNEIKAQCAIDIERSAHGLTHWFRVIDNAFKIADNTPMVDRDILIAFGLLHDSARTHDHHCEKHGPAANYVIRKYRNLIPLNDEQLQLLTIACVNHTVASVGEFIHNDNSVLVCFDADRLDLGRVGIVPDNAYLFTDAAKAIEIQQWANNNSTNGTVPFWAIELI